MATTRTFPLISVVCFCALTAVPRLPGSGGWYDESPAPLLADDLDRLPAKTLGEILLETVEKGKFEIAEITDKDAVANEEIEAVIEKIGKEKPEQLAGEIDSLVMKARLQYVLHGGVLNTLYDIRDAITAKGPSDEERKKYCTARLNFGMTPPEENRGPEKYAAGEPMRAHLLYLVGAVLFTNDKREEARPWLDEVVKAFPDHPRAESAAFLTARCALSKSRSFDDSGKDQEAEKKQAWDEATKLFKEYLKKYPQGRYVADAHGWLGALLWKDFPAEALEHYIAQLEDPAHPECRKSAAHMVERVLSKVVGHAEENEAVLKVVAQHPRVAQAAVYLVLNAPEIDPFDGKYDESADLKKWRQTVLPKLATLVAAEQARYQGAWALRLRAMLAQAASSVGKQEEALKLTDGPEADLKKSDDLLFARIVVLQRMKRPKDVAKLGRLFFDNFEKSQLTMGVAIRMAQALVDDHRGGEAYVFLSKAAGANEERSSRGDEGIYPTSEVDLELTQSGVYPDTDGGDAFAALKATILDFAPMKELEAVVGDKVWDEKPEALGSLTDALRIRKAAQEDYAAAAELGGDEPFKQSMEDFAKLAKAVKNASGRAKAQAMIALGDAYEETAGKESTSSDGGRSDLTKRDDARALGYADPDEELESRNMMRHATRWWLRAARIVPGTDLSAKARQKVLEGIEQIARESDYNFTRAMEANLSQVSRDICNVLLKENPKSAEARDAIYWSFEPCQKPQPKGKDEEQEFESGWSVRGQIDPGREVDALSLLGGYRAPHYNAFGEFPLAQESGEGVGVATGKFTQELTAKSQIPLELQRQFTAEMVADRFKELHALAATGEELKLANFYEDLTLFYQASGVSDKGRSAYIQMRLRADDYPYFNSFDGKPDPRPKLGDLIKAARANPELAAVQDFVDYVEIYANQADRGTGYDDFTYPNYKELEAGCRAFLAKHPKSLRRQACSLVMIRAIFRQLPDRFGHEGPGERHEHKMDDSREVVELNEPFRPAALAKAIADYEKEFPKPRYAAEMRNYKGIVAWRKFEYGPALELTIAQLDDKAHEDLRMEAAVRLANIFADLRDAKHRAAVLEALKTRPAAVEKLKAYLDVAPKNSQHPLRCMRRYLGDQLGFE